MKHVHRLGLHYKINNMHLEDRQTEFKDYFGYRHLFMSLKRSKGNMSYAWLVMFYDEATPQMSCAPREMKYNTELRKDPVTNKQAA